jgi:hypothetical protein
MAEPAVLCKHLDRAVARGWPMAERAVPYEDLAVVRRLADG